MSTTYGRSSFGYFWAVAEPVGGIVLLTLAFSLALRTPSLGTSFPLFYASGLLPFMAFLDISNKVAKSLVFSRPLLAFPTITYFDPLLARGILNGGTQILIMSIVIVSIVMGFQIDVILNLPLLASSALMALCLAFGIGTLNCFLFMRYPFWERVWSIVTRPLLFVSCIFYLFESIPEPYASVLWLNPLVHIVGEMRRGIYVTYQGEYVSHVYVYLFGLLPLLFGLLLLRRHYRDLVHN